MPSSAADNSVLFYAREWGDEPRDNHFRVGPRTLWKVTSKIDHAEMGRLIEVELPRLRRFAVFMARDSILADDLVQECLLRAVSHFDSWEPGTNLRAWLLTILRNVFITEIRRIQRMRNTVPYDETRQATVRDDMPDLAIDLAAVQRAFDRLSDKHREIMHLVALEEFTYEEAASILDLPIGTVRSRVSRARIALR